MVESSRTLKNINKKQPPQHPGAVYLVLFVWRGEGSAEHFHIYAPIKSVLYELVSNFKVVASFWNLWDWRTSVFKDRELEL